MNSEAGIEPDRVITELDEAMWALIALLEAEIKLVRAGKLRPAARLQPEKTRLVARYAAAAARLRQAGAELLRRAPERLERLRRRHEVFCEGLQTAVTMLGAARTWDGDRVVRRSA